ncbi:YybS family protein [Mechercharimyces sp. CAU 1602]|uniref:YybS family protein n=1 Tax=Mechercharimyces sp. CAU 1602 TaxID=2973933 RepID=UPI0021612754|nr:YybS family protein [Mechercharimyces sp. CAU 1602]MCS1352670.1 YybS family protein [Mechercharimyces sp. CAU 1602]
MKPINNQYDWIYSAVLFILIFILSFTPLGVVSIWFLPLPFMLLAAKQPLIPTLIFIVITNGSLLLGMYAVLGEEIATMMALLILPTVFIGLLMGRLYSHKEMSGSEVVLGGLMASSIVIILVFAISSSVFGAYGKLQAAWDGQWMETQTLFATLGIEEIGEPPQLQTLIPVLMAIIAIPIPLLNFWAGRRLLQKRIPLKRIPLFFHWRLPRSFLLFYGAMLLLGLIGISGGEDSFRWVDGVLLLLHMLFFLQGLSFVSYFLHCKHKNQSWMILVLFVSFIPLLSLLFYALGILDVGTKWRSRLVGKD